MEIWDILDENGNKIGKTMQRGESLPEGFYHLGVDVWIVYFIKQDIDINNIVMQEEEVCDVKWATYDEIEEIFQKGNFMENRWEYVRELIKEEI